MRLDGDAWREFFDSFRSSAWRLETRQSYAVSSEEEEYQQFLATGRLEIDPEDPWLKRVRHFRDTGRTIGRVHVVTRPFTDYLRYEFEVYRFTAEAGEDIRILDLTDTPNPGLPDEDFWLFDDRHVVRMLYRPDGTQISRELLEHPDIDSYLRYRRVAMREAVPLHAYSVSR